MNTILSLADTQLLQNHNIQIEIDNETKCGMIVFQNRRFKVNILNYVEGQAGQAMRLPEQQMRDTANKVAVMLLKKELLKAEPASNNQLLHCKIHELGITNIDDKKLITHEDREFSQKDTRQDYNALVAYLTHPTGEPQKIAGFPKDLSLEVQEVSALNTSHEMLKISKAALKDPKGKEKIGDEESIQDFGSKDVDSSGEGTSSLPVKPREPELNPDLSVNNSPTSEKLKKKKVEVPKEVPTDLTATRNNETIPTATNVIQDDTQGSSQQIIGSSHQEDLEENEDIDEKEQDLLDASATVASALQAVVPPQAQQIPPAQVVAPVQIPPPVIPAAATPANHHYSGFFDFFNNQSNPFTP